MMSVCIWSCVMSVCIWSCDECVYLVMCVYQIPGLDQVRTRFSYIHTHSTHTNRGLHRLAFLTLDMRVQSDSVASRAVVVCVVVCYLVVCVGMGARCVCVCVACMSRVPCGVCVCVCVSLCVSCG